MFLIVACGDAKGDQAAAEPAANEAKHEAEDPAQSALLLIHVSHTRVATMLALDSDWVVWPVAWWVSSAVMFIGSNNHNLLTGLHHHGLTWLHHHGLTWLLHHGLTWLHHHGLTWRSHRLRGILRLSHLLRGILWLLTNQGLLFGRDFSHSGVTNWFTVHRVSNNILIILYN